MKNKEIEELLKYLKENDYVRLDDNRTYKLLQDDEDKLLLSYIEQLQTTAKDCKQKLDQYENPDDLTLFYMWLDEKAKDKMKQLENKYDKALETLLDFNLPCERDEFNLIDTDYCELNCSVDDEQYKKCWDRWIEWRLENEIDKRNVN